MTPPQHGIFAEADEIEFKGDAMPADSLVSRANDKNLSILPCDDTSTKGLQFLSLTCDLARFELQLQRICDFGGDGVKTGSTNTVRRSRGCKVTCRRKTIWQRC